MEPFSYENLMSKRTPTAVKPAARAASAPSAESEHKGDDAE